jgi:hypothetical protein
MSSRQSTHARRHFVRYPNGPTQQAESLLQEDGFGRLPDLGRLPGILKMSALCSAPFHPYAEGVTTTRHRGRPQRMCVFRAGTRVIRGYTALSPLVSVMVMMMA